MRLRISHPFGLPRMAACAGHAELPAGAIPFCLVQKRHAKPIDHVVAALSRAGPIPFWLDVNWAGHPDRMPAYGRRLGAVPHGHLHGTHLQIVTFNANRVCAFATRSAAMFVRVPTPGCRERNLVPLVDCTSCTPSSSVEKAHVSPSRVSARL